jgi:hypothetical protein
VPERRCAGCGRRVAKKELVRFTTVDVSGSGLQIVIDERGKAGGRGVYLCRRLECFETAEKRKFLQRKLGASPIEPELKQRFARLTKTDHEQSER